MNPAERAKAAERWDSLLREGTLPYWYRTTMSPAGGYQLFDRGKAPDIRRQSWRGMITSLFSARKNNRRVAALRGLISQARILWVFSRAHCLGYSDPGQDYLQAADHGYSYFVESLLDREHGGFYWKADTNCGVTEPRKFLVGQAFAIFALVEYHRASRLFDPLHHALSVYQVVQEKLHDPIHRGWLEQAEPDWKLLTGVGLSLPHTPGLIGFKSADAHLHWFEALAELYAVTNDSSIRNSLIEVLELLKTTFFSPDAYKCCEYRWPDWEWIDDARYQGFDYGHLVEFAWLMLHAENILELPLSWDHFNRLLSYCLKYGFDHDRGGFYFRGLANQPAFDTDKIWWAQAEGLAALTDAATQPSAREDAAALDLLVSWIFNYQIRSDDGIWIWSTDSAGHPKNFTKAAEWKAAYHEFRAITKFIHGFAPSLAT